MRSKSGRNIPSSGILHIITPLVKMESAWEETEIMSSLWSSSLPKWLRSEIRGWNIKHAWKWRRIGGGMFLWNGWFKYHNFNQFGYVQTWLGPHWNHSLCPFKDKVPSKPITIHNSASRPKYFSCALFFFPWCSHSRDAHGSLILLWAGQGRK